MMRGPGYRCLRFRGQLICSYPISEISGDVWKFFPCRGRGILGQLLRCAKAIGIDRYLLSYQANPLDRYNIEVNKLIENVRRVLPSADNIILSWPSPLRSTFRFYGLVIDFKGTPIAYMKFASDKVNADSLEVEFNALKWIERNDKIAGRLHIPKAYALERIGDLCYLITENLPVKSMPFITRDVSSWEDVSWCKKIISERSVAVLPKNQAMALEWVNRFAKIASPKAFMIFQNSIQESGMKVCATHGDFSGHNFRVSRDGIWIFDWEGFDPVGPIRADEFYFKLTADCFAGNRSFGEAIQKIGFSYEYIQAAAFLISRDLSFKKELIAWLEKGG